MSFEDDPIDIRIKQGATFRLALNYMDQTKTSYDLNGFTAHMQIRTSSGSLICDLTTENGGITLNEDGVGNIDIYISDEDTAAMNFTSAKYDFFLLYPNGERECVFQGKVAFAKAETIHG
jgi:hypothetical protein